MSFVMRVMLLSLLISLNLGMLRLLWLIISLLRLCLIMLRLAGGVVFFLPIIIIVISLIGVVGLLTRGPRICLMLMRCVLSLWLVETLIGMGLTRLWLGGRLLHRLSLLL